MKVYWAFIFCTFLLTSCQFTQKELPNSQELLRRELHAIDWDRVDAYPSYATCDTIQQADEAMACFFERLQLETLRVLKNDSLVKISTIDTVDFLVTVSNQSELQFKTEMVNEKLLPKWMLDSIMQQNIKQFSKIQPASKRGVPVTTQFRLNLKISSLD